VMEWHSIIVLFISAVHYLYFCLLSKRTDWMQITTNY
jgi:hypothetical protein